MDKTQVYPEYVEARTSLSIVNDVSTNENGHQFVEAFITRHSALKKESIGIAIGKADALGMIGKLIDVFDFSVEEILAAEPADQSAVN